MSCVSCQIKDLTLNSHSFFINALIIAKTEKKIFNSARGMTGVITFTVRDTKDHFINCCVWGSDQYIESCERAHKIGNVITIYAPKVLQKNDNSNLYYPRTTSPFELRVNERKSFIHPVIQPQECLLQLRNRAIKPTSIALNLNDIIFSPGMDNLTADLMVLVRFVDSMRQVQTKFGMKWTRKVYLMDTTMELISMTVWHSDYQERMDQWKPMETILHLVDVRIEYSTFERSTILSLTSRTIIVENPIQSSRSNEILAYIHELSEAKIEQLKNIIQKPGIELTAIHNVMSIKRIFDEIERDPNKEFAAIVYGVITKFDINAAVVKSCVHCKRLLMWNCNECRTSGCNLIKTNGPKYIDKIYMAISIADHSGTLNCRITDEYAQNILGHTVDELKMLTDDDTDAIFNKFILERFAIKMIIRPKSQTEYFASIVNIEIDTPDHIAQTLKP